MKIPVFLKLLTPLSALALLGNLSTQPSTLAHTPSIASLPHQRVGASDVDEVFAAGMRHLQANQLHNAFEQFQQAYKLYRQQRNTRGETIALAELIRLSIHWQDYESAIQYNKQLLILHQGMMNQQGTAEALETFARIYQAWPRYQSAISYYTLTLNTRRQLRDRPGEANVLSQLGSIHQTIGNLQQALTYHQQSLAIHSELGDSLGLRQSLHILGNVYQALGDSQNAIAYYEKSLNLADKLGDRSGYGKTLGDLGRLYESRNPKQALNYQEKSLTIARNLKDKLAEAEALSNLGNAYYAMGDWPKAIDYQQQSFDHSVYLHHPIGQGIAAHHLGRAYFKANDLENAEIYLRHAIEKWKIFRRGLSDINAIIMADTQESTYRLLQTVLVQQKRAEDALVVAENARARAFAELLNHRSRFAPGENTSSTDYTPALSQSLKNLRITAHRQNATLMEYSLIDDRTLYIWVIKPTGYIMFQEVDLTQFPGAIEELVAMSRLSMGIRSARNHTIRNTIRNTMHHTIYKKRHHTIHNAMLDQHTPHRQTIKNNPQNANTQNTNTQEEKIQEDNTQEAHPHLRQLHQMLIEPIAQHLPTDPNQRVVFIPQGSLFMVPFPALKDGQGKYLIEQHTLSTAPSIHTLVYTQEIRKRQDFIAQYRNPNHSWPLPLIVGNPTMATIADMTLLPLPHAEQEATTIAKLLGTQALLGRQATKQAVLDRISQAPIVHLATHGLLDLSEGGILGTMVLYQFKWVLVQIG
ncbi:MAG: CHAT domain-containing tetratricopeptide repeat protein, partial [Synechococcales bacterium]|nr:CHAT domain-containing tetratricopeptide repeat protein [Synechococcales bacterium]